MVVASPDCCPAAGFSLFAGEEEKGKRDERRDVGVGGLLLSLPVAARLMTVAG